MYSKSHNPFQEIQEYTLLVQICLRQFCLNLGTVHFSQILSPPFLFKVRVKKIQKDCLFYIPEVELLDKITNNLVSLPLWLICPLSTYVCKWDVRVSDLEKMKGAKTPKSEKAHIEWGKTKVMWRCVSCLDFLQYFT